MAKVSLTPEAREQFGALPRIIRERMTKLFERLGKWPDVSGAKPLTGKLVGWLRLRTGDYRLRFRVQGEEVLIDKIGHRKDIYEE
jgi:mRNA interferase RelE/StbE